MLLPPRRVTLSPSEPLLLPPRQNPTNDAAPKTNSYIQAAGGFAPYWRNKFAYPLMYNVSGSIHNHLIAWKVDLDVLGTANTVNMHTVGVQKKEIPGLGMPIWNHR